MSTSFEGQHRPLPFEPTIFTLTETGAEAVVNAPLLVTEEHLMCLKGLPLALTARHVFVDRTSSVSQDIAEVAVDAIMESLKTNNPDPVGVALWKVYLATVPTVQARFRDPANRAALTIDFLAAAGRFE